MLLFILLLLVQGVEGQSFWKMKKKVGKGLIKKKSTPSEFRVISLRPHFLCWDSNVSKTLDAQRGKPFIQNKTPFKNSMLKSGSQPPLRHFHTLYTLKKEKKQVKALNLYIRFIHTYTQKRFQRINYSKINQEMFLQNK